MRNPKEIDAGPAETRTAILDAAERRYFGDKRALFERVVDRVLNEGHDVLAAEAARATPGTAHTLRIVLAACLAFARDRSVLRGLLLRDADLVRAAAAAVIEDDRGLPPRLIQEILERGVRRGDVRGDLATEDMAHVVSETFVSYSLLLLKGETGQVGERRVDAVIETLLHGAIAASQT